MPDALLIAWVLYGIGAFSTALLLIAMQSGELPWRWWVKIGAILSVPLWPVAVPLAAGACLADEWRAR